MKSIPVRLLLADDDEDDCFLFQQALEELALLVHLTVVHDGEELMQLLYQEDAQLPDLLFLDLNMPRKNGFECLTLIKQDERFKKFPVIIYSTSSKAEFLNATNGQNDAQYYLQKPAKFSELCLAIQQVFNSILETNASQPPFLPSH